MVRFYRIIDGELMVPKGIITMWNGTHTTDTTAVVVKDICSEKNVDTFKRGDNENYYVTEFNKGMPGRDFLDPSWTEESVLEQRINQANSMNSVSSNRRRGSQKLQIC